MDTKLVQTKVYCKREYTIIASNVMRSEEFLITGNPINILGWYFRKEIYTLTHEIKYLHMENLIFFQ